MLRCAASSQKVPDTSYFCRLRAESQSCNKETRTVCEPGGRNNTPMAAGKQGLEGTIGPQWSCLLEVSPILPKASDPISAPQGCQPLCQQCCTGPVSTSNGPALPGHGPHQARPTAQPSLTSREAPHSPQWSTQTEERWRQCCTRHSPTTSAKPVREQQ